MKASGIAACRSVLMVGTHMTTMGGISTVVRGYQRGGLFDCVDCRYITTHRDGGTARKLTTAIGAMALLLAALLRGRAPLIHIHISSRASFWRKSIVCLLAMAARRPYLLHVHGSEFMKFYDEECGPRAKRFVRFILEHAALVLALSERWRDDLLRIAPAACIEPLPNAVDLPDLAQRQLPPRDQPIILFLGRLGQRKGTFDLIHAFAHVVQLFPGARLVCAGDGDIDAVRTLASKLQVADRLSCPGWVDPSNTGELLRAATLFALPSYAEGLPMALLEAMSWALPVVTTPIGGIPQAVRDGENGVLVPPGDHTKLAAALIALLCDDDARARLGSQARLTIERSFSLPIAIEQLLRVYRRFGIPLRDGSPKHGSIRAGGRGAASL